MPTDRVPRCPICRTTTPPSSPTSRPRSSSSTTASTTRPTSTAPTRRSRSSPRPAPRDDFGTINQLQKNLAFHLSGHVLHSMFWKNMTPDGGGKPEGDLRRAVNEDFGDVRRVQGQLTEAALNVQGSGWGALSWEPRRPAADRRAGLRPPEQRRPGRPAAPRARHVGARLLPAVREREGRLGEAFWEIVNWPDVADRFVNARTLDLGLEGS